MGIRQWIDEVAVSHETDLVLLEPDYLDPAILGVTHDGEHVVYSYDKLVEQYQKSDGMTADEAIEFVDYNTIRALPYMGENKPVIVYSPVEVY